MAKVTCLKDLIGVNSDFRNAINIYLNLNSRDKVLGYIPTKSSVKILKDYLESVLGNKEQATLLIGPYGKGKSHLLLVLLAILSLERNEENTELITKLFRKIQMVDEIGEATANLLVEVWNKNKRFLPVVIMDTQGDLNQAFLYAMHEALKRENLVDIIPDTYYSIAIERIQEWKKYYKETYAKYDELLREKGSNAEESVADLNLFNSRMLNTFIEIYPKLTSGSQFNPLAASEVLPLYKSMSEKLCKEYGYSGIYIIFDEFSKFIEGQDNFNTGNNMKLLQDICELSIDSKKEQVMITMVAHKSIKEYGSYLSKEIINSFTGIEGRIKEKYFVTSSKNNYELIKNAIVKRDDELAMLPDYEGLLGENVRSAFYQLPYFRTNFNEDDFEKTVLRGCYPLNPISAYLLLNVSEKVAQNERSLFTFISKDEQHSMARYVAEHTGEQQWSVTANLIYDYFSNLFKKDVSNEYIHNEWLNAEYALSKCETSEERNVIKALALLQIVNNQDAFPANKQIIHLASGCSDDIVDELVQKQVLYHKGATDTYAFKTRAGSTLKAEIKKRRGIKEDKFNVASVLAQVTDKYFVISKKYNHEYMMTRYFRHEYMDYDAFIRINDSAVFFDSKNFADGIVISLYSMTRIVDIEEVKAKLAQFADSRVIVNCSKDVVTFKKQIIDYEIIQDLKADYLFINSNEIISRELPLFEDDIANEIKLFVDEIFDKNSSKLLYYTGDSVKELKMKQEEFAVGECCERLYYATPIINNEIINRKYITTSQTKKTRKTIVETIWNKKDDENFYAGNNQEATIYRSLFKVTGILEGKPSQELQNVIDVMNNFVESCSDKKRCMAELVNVLTATPYGMREGVIPIYWAYVLSKRKEDLVVYFSKMESEITADILVNMCDSAEDYYLFVSKEDVEKEQYIENLQELFRVKDGNNLSDYRINNIFTCMQRWFRSLPQISRSIGLIDGYDVATGVEKYLAPLRKTLQKTEINPYEMLFVSIPTVLDSQDSFAEAYRILEQCKLSFDRYYDWILQQIVEETFKIFDEKKKLDLYHTLSEWYEKQSSLSKEGLHSSKITGFMSCIKNMNVFDDIGVAQKVAKVVTDIYVENWNDKSFDEYLELLKEVKSDIEQLHDQVNNEQSKLVFEDKHGNKVERYYTRVNEGTGTILKNVIEDALDEFDDLSVNDRVAILLEMIEKVIG